MIRGNGCGATNGNRWDRYRDLIGITVCGVGLLLPTSGWAQSSVDPPATGNSTGGKAGAPVDPVVGKSDAPTTVRGRLPNHYGKLGITREQRDRIYRVMAGYRKQVIALQKQIMDLEQESRDEVESVLTDDQRSVLQKFVKEAEARRQKRLKAQREN